MENINAWFEWGRTKSMGTYISNRRTNTLKLKWGRTKTMGTNVSKQTNTLTNTLTNGLNLRPF